MPDALRTPSVRRRWGFRVLALFLGPVLFLGLAELGLRAVGYGHSTHFTERFERDGVEYLRDNPGFFTLFFPENLLPRQLPFVLPAQKPAGSLRVALLGGSAALGIPEPAFGMGPILEEELRARHPERDIEVLNLANTAINSHVVREIAASLEPLDPDVIVVYLGNNEVVGPFGAGTVFTGATPGRAVIDLQLALRRTRLGQLLTSLASRKGGPTRWRGMQMFSDRTVRSDDPALERVRNHYRENLRAIVAAGHRLDVPVVLASVEVNWRHCAPFATDPVLGSASDRPFQDGNRAWEKGDIDGAVAAYTAAVAVDSTHAEAQFRRGRLALGVGDSLTARTALRAAIDHDALRFRHDSALRGILAEVVADGGVVYAPVAEAIRAASPGGIPGGEMFFEHVHLDYEGNRIAARQICAAVESALEELPATGGWLSAAALNARLGYTPFERARILNRMGSLVSKPPFVGQSSQREQLARFRRALEQLAPMNTGDQLAAQWSSYESAMEGSGRWIRRFRAAEFLTEGLKDYARALPLWAGVVDELPRFAAARNGYARCLADAGQPSRARAEWETSLEIDPWQPQVMIDLAQFLRGQPNAGPDERWEAVEIESHALRMDATTESRGRLRKLLAAEADWFEGRGEGDRARKLRKRLEKLESADQNSG